MANYYVNTYAEANGEHEVHTEVCIWLPERKNRVYLGGFIKSKHALRKAKKYYTRVKGCYYCSRDAHRALI